MTTHPSSVHPGQAALVRELAKGGLLSAEWREIWEQTPRHRFIPNPAWRQLRRSCELVTGPERMDLIYSDEPVVTQLDNGDNGDNGEGGGPGIATSSNSMPSMVARQLRALDVRPGHRVLEIGTATGYVSALLCRRVGEENVFSVEIDGVLAAQARANLAAEGLHPTTAVADGELGLPAHAPYDRILSTCALRRVPPSLAGQLAPGGRAGHPDDRCLLRGRHSPPGPPGERRSGGPVLPRRLVHAHALPPAGDAGPAGHHHGAAPGD
ncbi:methyltransferase domain-containing protein [Streptomyces olivaceiscleroticus]|uniref:Protein-L-isoaspartate O-methyltransferase n=1 Tax=Streptomyces olivaceiscleroticus TaxID=68245 RepID=A0ABN1A006_9ACTN